MYILRIYMLLLTTTLTNDKSLLSTERVPHMDKTIAV
jgi:hypothetical protein